MEVKIDKEVVKQTIDLLFGKIHDNSGVIEYYQAHPIYLWTTLSKQYKLINESKRLLQKIDYWIEKLYY